MEYRVWISIRVFTNYNKYGVLAERERKAIECVQKLHIPEHMQKLNEELPHQEIITQFIAR